METIYVFNEHLLWGQALGMVGGTGGDGKLRNTRHVLCPGGASGLIVETDTTQTRLASVG